MPSFIDVFLSPIRDSQTAQVLIAALLIGIALDMIIGLLGAALRHEVKSSKMRVGVMHKIAEVGLVVVADVLDGMIMGGLRFGVAPVLPATAGFLTLMELLSICENCVAMNPDFADIPLIGTVTRLLADAQGNSGERHDKDIEE